MSLETVKRLLKKKENIHLEFKRANTDLPDNLFETICAMLNRDGGDIFLGVMDDGTVVGVEERRINVLKTNVVNLSNNPQKIDPPFILFPIIYEINKKHIIHIQVPASSQVHRTNSFVYDRSNDGDFKVTEPHRIAELYNRKRAHYTESTIYPALHFDNFKQDLFPKVRNLIRSNNPNHPWLALNDKQMLQKAGLWRKDLQTGQEGYTLAAALLLGKEEIIHNILPHYKTDALVRVTNLSRYDDREYIDTNLIESYEKLMAFVEKHLPDKFYMEGDQRVSLRTKIFRELVANLLIHREYTNAYPATFVIYKDRVETDNANNPHVRGTIQPNNFVPFPKNPTIAKFFIQLGRVEELGSGVLNITKFLVSYSPGKHAQFIEGDSFKTIIPLDEKLVDGHVNDTVNDIISDTVSDTVSDSVKVLLVKVVKIIKDKPGLMAGNIAMIIKKSIPTTARYMRILKAKDIIQFKGAPKTGGYYLTESIAKKLGS